MPSCAPSRISSWPQRLAAFGEVTAAVAHGLGNPLAAIRACAQVALLDAVGPQREPLLRIVADTDRLRARMRALLDLGRPVMPRPVPTALDAAIRRRWEPCTSGALPTASGSTSTSPRISRRCASTRPGSRRPSSA